VTFSDHTALFQIILIKKSIIANAKNRTDHISIPSINAKTIPKTNENNATKA